MKLSLWPNMGPGLEDLLPGANEFNSVSRETENSINLYHSERSFLHNTRSFKVV